MRKKFLVFSISSLVLFLLIQLFTYYFYHYYTAEGFGFVWNAEPFKPLIALLFGILGTLFLFSSILSLLIALIFYKK